MLLLLIILEKIRKLKWKNQPKRNNQNKFQPCLWSHLSRQKKEYGLLSSSNRRWGHCWGDQQYFMQGGATCHTIPSNLEFLLNKFNGRLISNKTDIAWRIVSKLNWIDIAWLSNNPDLNPLDFFFWGHSMTYVFHCKLLTIDEMKQVVNDFST